MTCHVICPECGQQFPDGVSFKKHKKYKHSNIEKFKEEQRENKIKKLHICDLCARQFEKRSALSYHINVFHTDNSHIACGTCGKKFSSVPNLAKHKLLHEAPQIPCAHCAKLFHTIAYLKRHVLSQHTDQNDMPFHCDQCGRGFPNPKNLEGHMNMHLGLKPFKCR